MGVEDILINMGKQKHYILLITCLIPLFYNLKSYPYKHIDLIKYLVGKVDIFQICHRSQIPSWSLLINIFISAFESVNCIFGFIFKVCVEFNMENYQITILQQPKHSLLNSKIQSAYIILNYWDFTCISSLFSIEVPNLPLLLLQNHP